LYEQISLALDNEDLGKTFYEILFSNEIKLIDFENLNNNSFHVVTELPCKNGEDEFRPDITLLINGMPLAFIEVKKPNNKEGILAERNRINTRFQNKKFRKFINITQLLVFSNNMEYDDESIDQVEGAYYASTSYKQAIFNAFKEEYNLEEDAFIQAQTFGPAIGDEIRRKAIISILIAAIGMLLYITFRFELKFGISAIVALVHDVLIALAVYALLRIPVNSSFVAAILTIVGYSINDTIVVFDRIRENLDLMKKEKYDDIVNKSISQTIIRSINTSFTTLIAIVTLYILGVEAIKDFALPLIVGVLAGTYSSIFIASPVWSMLRKKFPSKGYKANRA